MTNSKNYVSGKQYLHKMCALASKLRAAYDDAEQCHSTLKTYKLRAAYDHAEQCHSTLSTYMLRAGYDHAEQCHSIVSTYRNKKIHKKEIKEHIKDWSAMFYCKELALVINWLFAKIKIFCIFFHTLISLLRRNLQIRLFVSQRTRQVAIVNETWAVRTINFILQPVPYCAFVHCMEILILLECLLYGISTSTIHTPPFLCIYICRQ